MVSQSVSLGVVPHLGLMTRYLLLFDSYGLVLCGAPSLTRGWVCLLYMLLALASAVFLRSESLGTHNHILLSHEVKLPFSSPPMTRRVMVEVFDLASTRVTKNSLIIAATPCYVASAQTTRKTPLPRVLLLLHACLLRPLPGNSHCLQSHYLATAVV
jgi:hypothetical protein